MIVLTLVLNHEWLGSVLEVGCFVASLSPVVV